MASSALEQFTIWLPGELEYSVRKAPYTDKLPRTYRGTDPTSTYGFMGTQWFRSKMMRNAGNHHSTEHQVTGQLQLAKFAAGIFDKVAMLEWIKNGMTPELDAQIACANKTATGILPLLTAHEHLGNLPDPLAELEKGFEDSIFSQPLLVIQNKIGEVAQSHDATELKQAQADATALGLLATQPYVAYAEYYLNETNQLVLAPSQLA